MAVNINITTSQTTVTVNISTARDAYQLAVANGFVGDRTAWLASLVGADGPSAYAVAVNNGFVGNEAAWLASLVGATGASAYAVAVANGFVGDQAAWLASLVGADGPSAYAVAVANGFVGNQAAWLASLVGADGPSAYAVAVDNGFVGDEAAWLASLVGDTGPQGPAGPTAIVDNSTGAVSPGAGNEGTLYRCSNAGGTSFIIPTHATVPYALKTVLYARRMTSAGPVTISGSGVTINDNASADVPSGGLMAVIKVDEDVWDFI